MSMKIQTAVLMMTSIMTLDAAFSGVISAKYAGGSGDLIADAPDNEESGYGPGDINFGPGNNAETFSQEDTDESSDDDSDDEPVLDFVDKFLRDIEIYAHNKENCTPGTQYHLGKGVINQYGVNRFKQQAEVAVNRANLLTQIWRGDSSNLLDSEYFVYSMVMNLIQGDEVIFGAGNCYDAYEFKDYSLFCAYGFRNTENTSEITVKDLSIEYKYLGNDSEFFIIPRQKAELKLAEMYNSSMCKLIPWCYSCQRAHPRVPIHVRRLQTAHSTSAQTAVKDPLWYSRASTVVYLKQL